MQDDDHNTSDRTLVILTAIVGVVIVGYVVYALIVYLHLSSILSRFVR